jgi:PAS domain S-box-containing protein
LSEERLRLALDGARMGTWHWDLVTNEILWSDTYRQLFGLPPDAPGSYEGWLACLHPQDREAADQQVRQAMDARTDFDTEYRIRWPDGTPRWLAAKGRFYYRDDGTPARMEGVVVDITARKAAEADLQNTQFRLTEAQRISHLGSFEYDAATRQTHWSDEEYRIYGLDPAGPSPDYDTLLAQFIHPDDAPQLHQNLSTAIANRAVHELEHRIIRADGRVRWLYELAHPYCDQDGTLVRYIGSTLDITERKEAEERLRRSEERLRLALDGAQMGTWHWDLDTHEVVWSDTCCALFGRPPGTLGDYEAFIAAVHPQDRAAAAQAVHRALDEHDAYQHEFRILWPDGTQRWIRAEGRFYGDTDGTPRRMEGVARDITARVEAEQALTATNLRLQGLLDALPVGVGFTDGLDPGHIQANATLRRLYELPPAGEISASAADPAAPGRAIRYFHAGRELAADELPVQRALAEGQPIPALELEIALPSGRRWIAEVTAVPLRDTAGQIIGALAVAVDITARKAAEEDLRRLHATLEAALGAMSDAVFISDTEGRFLYFNDAFATFHKFKNKADCAKTLAEYPVYLDVFLADGTLVPLERWAVPRALRGETVSGAEYRLRLKHTGETWVGSYNFAPIRAADGAIIGSVVTGRDVTEDQAIRQALERERTHLQDLVTALRASERRFAYAMEATSDGIWDWDLPTGAVYYSPGYAAMLGLAPADLAPDVSTWIALIHPEERDGIVAAAERQLADPGHYELEFRVRTTAGDYRWVLSRGKVVERAAGGAPVRAVGTHVDITERKAVEEEIHALTADLERRVAERTAALVAAQAELQEVLGRVARSEARFRTMFEESPQGIALIDSLSGQICEVNAGFAAIVGRSRAAMTTIDWMQITHPDDLQEELDQMARLNAGELSGFHMNKRYLRPDGASVWVRMIIAPVTVAAGERPRHLKLIEDITARREAEERLRGITEAAHDAILMMNPQGAITYWNPAATAILGYTAAEALGQNLHRLLAPARYLSEHRAAFPAFQHSGQGAAVGKTTEMFAKRKDGQEIAVSLALSALALEGGWHAIGILRDVSERQRLEQALAASEERYRLAIDATSEGLWDVNLVTGAQVVNNQWFALLGYTPGAVTPAYDLWRGHVYPDDVARIDHAFAAHLEGRSPTYTCDYRVITQSGQVRWHHTAGQVVARDAHGTAVRMIGTTADITDRVATEQRIQETLSLLQVATRAADIGIWTWEFASGKLDWDERLCAWYEVPAATRANGLSYDFWKARVHPDDRAHAESVLAAAVRDNTPYEDIFRLLLPGARVRYIHTSAVIEPDADGRPWRVIGVNRDITAQREQEENLRTAKQAAEVAANAKSEFLAHMSHEIRTPLNSVLGLLQVLERSALDPDQRALVVQVLTAGRSLLGILNDILDLSKIEAGQLPLQARPFGLAPLLADLGALLGSAARDKGLVLAIDPPPALAGGLVGDPQRLEQILVNLIGNAIKFTDRGQVQVQVTPRERTTATVRLRFAVRDTGIGIAPESLAGLFTPFIQADASITRRFGGTGLGLAICKRLVERMGGAIGAESVPGEGSTFWCELPFIRTAETAEEPPARHLATAPAGARLAGLHLLVVDDSAMNREVAERMLALEGARATLAGDGRQAIEWLRSAPSGVDAVLMDVQMPIMDGLTATRLIRTELGLTALPVIALTAGVLPEEQQRAHAAGVTDFLPKPLDLEQLVAVVRRWVPPGPSGDTNPVVGDRSSPQSTTIPTIPGIAPERLATLCQGDAAVCRRLLRGLVVDLTGVDQQVQADLDQGAPARAVEHLHRLRGAAANLGATDLAHSAQALEEAVQTQRPEVAELLPRFKAHLASLLGAVVPLLTEPEPSQTAPVAPAGTAEPLDEAKLVELRTALADHKPRPARRLVAELEAGLISVYGVERVRHLAAALESMRFEEALDWLEAAGERAPGRDRRDD